MSGRRRRSGSSRGPGSACGWSGSRVPLRPLRPAGPGAATVAPGYEGRSVASIGVAAHEAGHALQHAKGYLPLQWHGHRPGRLDRRASWPGRSVIGFLFRSLGLLMPGSSCSPRRWSSSSSRCRSRSTRRAGRWPSSAPGDRHRDGGGGRAKVLTAAAMTYVAAAATAILSCSTSCCARGSSGGGRRD